MKFTLRSLAGAGLALLLPLSGFAALQAAAPSPLVELKAIVAEAKAKISQGKNTAQDLAPEIAALDALLAKYKDQKTDEVAQVAYTEAMLYQKVLNDPGTAAKLIAAIRKDYPGTKTAADIAVPAAGGGSGEGGAVVAEEATKLSTGQEWMTDWAKAKETAAKDHKKMLVDFTGSDWCGYCIKLENEVFTTDDFAKFAKDYVLVRLDYPQKKQLPEAEAEQNKGLKDEFAIRGYPTVIVADATGKEISRQVGYRPGSGPDDYLPKLTASAD
jgi:thiol-disulfide isomerase/thioredoxin